jgi:hypothetical protein
VGGEPGVEDERGEEQCGAEGGDFDSAADRHGSERRGGRELAERVVPCWLELVALFERREPLVACDSERKERWGGVSQECAI